MTVLGRGLVFQPVLDTQTRERERERERERGEREGGVGRLLSNATHHPA